MEGEARKGKGLEVEVEEQMVGGVGGQQDQKDQHITQAAALLLKASADCERLKALGADKFKEKNYLEAIKYFDQAAAAAILYSEGAATDTTRLSQYAICKSNAAQCCINLKDYAGAIQNSSEALSKDPCNVKALYRRGASYLALSEGNKAVVDFQACLGFDPENKTIQAELEKATSMCFEEGATVEGVCTRCEKSLTSSAECCVPHPIALREDQGAEYSKENRQFYSCRACSQFWTEITTMPSDKNEPIVKRIEGPQYCFVGPHSSAPLKKSDLRVIRSTELNLYSGPDLQNQLNNLSTSHPHIKKLTIHSGDRRENESYSLTAVLPNLEDLIIDMVTFKRLDLTNTTVPKLTKLNLSNVSGPGMCFNVTTSSLKEITMMYFTEGLDIRQVNQMLAAATKLEYFASRKLIVYGESLRFSSNYLKTVILIRSDCLRGVTLWAPRLQSINLGACYDLEEVKILQTHALAASLPPNFKPSRFTIDLTATDTPPHLISYLRRHRRVDSVIHDDDDDDNCDDDYCDDDDDDDDDDYDDDDDDDDFDEDYDEDYDDDDDEKDLEEEEVSEDKEDKEGDDEKKAVVDGKAAHDS